MPYLYLTLAIIAEVIATSALKATQNFTAIGPSLIVLIGYGIAFYLLTLVLRHIPLGLTYALWSGFGIVLVTLSGAFIYRQIPDLPALFGIALIIAGSVVIHLYSKMSV